MHLMKREST